LALARIGVGVGEAALSPPAHSLLADYFPVRTRHRARRLRDGDPLRDPVRRAGWRLARGVLGLARPSSSWACRASCWRSSWLTVRSRARYPGAVRPWAGAEVAEVVHFSRPGARSSISLGIGSPRSQAMHSRSGPAVSSPRTRRERRARYEDRHRSRRAARSARCWPA
jgi:hypothetical protein